MPNTYSQIYLHTVFTVKGRENLLPKKIRQQLFTYIIGIMKSRNQTTIAINGVEDHIHMLFRLRPNQRISDLMKEVKAGSSRFINQQQLIKGKFAWQEGYGAFSCGRKDVESVSKYIHDQEEHHKRHDFKEEYIGLLKEHGIDFEEQYLFDFMARKEIDEFGD